MPIGFLRLLNRRRPDARLFPIFPVFRVVEEELDGLKVEPVPGLPGHEPSGDRASEKVEVAYEIKDLMANELIREAEGAVNDLFGVQDDRIREGPTQSQPLPPEFGHVLEEAERPGRSDPDAKGPFRHLEVDLLLADGGMVEINDIGDLEPGPGRTSREASSASMTKRLDRKSVV